MDSELRACQDLISGESVLAKGKSVIYHDLVTNQNLKNAAKQELECLKAGALIESASASASGFGSGSGGVILEKQLSSTSPSLFKQDSHKVLSDGDGGQVHVHLTVENLASCFFNFGSAEAGAFPFTPKPEAANSKNISPKFKSISPKSDSY